MNPGRFLRECNLPLNYVPVSFHDVFQIKADYYADPIPSFRFWSGRKNKYHSCKIETGFLCGDGARVIRSFARVIQRLGFGTHRKLQPTSATGTSGAAPSALRSALGSSIHAYAQTLVWPRRDVPRRFTWYFFQQCIRAKHESCCSACTLA